MVRPTQSNDWVMGNQITSLVTHLPDLQQSLFGLFSLTTTGKIPPIYDPIRPPSYPLAVRSPYLSAWIPGAYILDLPSSSPQFWAGQNLSWSIIARVDGVTYNLFGVQHPGIGTRSASVKSAEYTSTHSIFTLDAGPGAFKLDFFSPVSPSNYLRQSLPFSMKSSQKLSRQKLTNELRLPDNLGVERQWKQHPSVF